MMIVLRLQSSCIPEAGREQRGRLLMLSNLIRKGRVPKRRGTAPEQHTKSDLTLIPVPTNILQHHGMEKVRNQRHQTVW